MGFKIEYDIDKVWFRDFSEMVGEMLDKQSADRVPLRWIFFGNPDNNAQYLEHLACIRRLAEERFGAARLPLISYVAQQSLDSGLVLESHYVDAETALRYPIRREELRGSRYFVVETEHGRCLLSDGVLPSSLDNTMLDQSEEVLSVIGDMLTVEGMELNTIVRQWNYIEEIVAFSNGNQHYQDFNDARSHFYAQTEWGEGYPAATGIGTKHGGIMVAVDAIDFSNKKCQSVALDNHLQVAAHVYSQNVLIGVADKIFRQKTTPKFERAKAVVLPHFTHVYISGTAAIRGEESLTDVGIEQQTVITLENIEFLVSRPNLKKYGVRTEKSPEIKLFRVYLKSENYLEPAREIIHAKYPNVPTLYVLSDVCRDELLIEIEGIAQTD